MNRTLICLISTIRKVRSNLWSVYRMRLIWFETIVVEALSAKVGTLSLEAQARLEKDTAKKEAKAEAKADAALKKKLASHVRRYLFLTG